jgi:DNA-binding MarR family transcriptional regulator
MATTRQGPDSTPDGPRPGGDLWSGDSGDSWDSGDSGDAWDLIEVQSAALVRNLELLRRRGDIYGPLDRASYLLLRTLEATGPADINTLATAVGLDPSTAGRQVADMRGKGLIESAPAATDRRRSIISPTPEGRRRADDARCLRREATMRLLAGWSEEELCALGDTFARFNRAVTALYLGAAGTPTGQADGTPVDFPGDGTAAARSRTRMQDRKEPPHDEQ